ncbi:hypothetical protein SEA_NICEHOUSE_227 [Rhodococcus phage NiceHouse]|nr:hypothetical protein SEA_NICEHOUSE_227 [Rhodococcus phage NiceHouse]
MVSFLDSWTKLETQDLWMRVTPVNHGIVIQHPDDGPGYIGETKEMPRRHSVIKKVNDKYTLQIGSIAYHTGYDSFNPLEPFVKYLNGEFEVLLEAGPYDEAQVEGWNGQPDTIER